MAKISARGATALCQVKASKPEGETQLTADGKTHLTLTLTSDGRILWQTHHNFRSSSAKCGYRRSAAGMRVLGHVDFSKGARTPEERSRLLGDLAKRYGYTPDGKSGTCEFCHSRNVVLPAVLAADTDQRVCAACHSDARLPTQPAT